MMPKIDNLMLISGTDILLDEYGVTVRQPTINEISVMGEGDFFNGVSAFNISGEPFEEFILAIDDLSDEEKDAILEGATPYDYLLFLLKVTNIDEDDRLGIYKMTKGIVELMIPTHNFVFNVEEGIMFLMSKDLESTLIIDRVFFDALRTTAFKIFKLEELIGVSREEQELSPTAQAIADKMAKAEAKIKELGGEEGEDMDYFSRIVSILGVHKEIGYLTGLTVYQLQDQFKRFNLYTNYSHGTQAAFAGATNIELVDWYGKL